MVRHWWKQGTLATVLCGAATFAGAQEEYNRLILVGSEQTQEQEQDVQEVPAEGAVIRGVLTPPSGLRLFGTTNGFTLLGDAAETSGTGATFELSKFWIGVSCEPIGDALKAQLNRSQGLYVSGIMPNSPAANADVREHDILTRLNDTELTDVEQLGKLVDKHGGEEVTLTILRGGKEATLKVKLAERPAATSVQGTAAGPAEAEAEKIRLETVEKGLKWLSRHGQDMELMVVRPGVAFPADRIKATAWPKDVKVHVQKEGDKPATIEIKRGEQSWKVTEDTVGELPEDIRVLVEQMRGGSMKVQVEGGPEPQAIRHFQLFTSPATMSGRVTALPAMPMTTAVPAQPGMPATITAHRITGAGGLSAPHAQLDDVNQKLDVILQRLSGDNSVQKLEKEVERLRVEVDGLREQLKK